MTPLMITQMARNAAVRSAEQARSSSVAQGQHNSEPASSGQPSTAPVRRCLFAYFPSPVPMPPTAPTAPQARRPRSTPFGRCDSTSYAYCALAAALFLVGALMFIFMYLSAAAHGTHERPANLDDGWLVGPIFMCTGLLLGIKNLLYMRRAKLLFDLLLAQEQRANGREFHDIESCVNRNASVATLPPSYDVAVTMPLVSNQRDGVKDNDGAAGSNDAFDGGLPSYDEALRLLCDNRASGAPAYNEGNSRIIMEAPEESETRRTGTE